MHVTSASLPSNDVIITPAGIQRVEFSKWQAGNKISSRPTSQHVELHREQIRPAGRRQTGMNTHADVVDARQTNIMQF